MPDGELDTILGEAFRRLNEISRRLRAIEERAELSDAAISSSKDIIIKNRADFDSAVERISTQINSLDSRLAKIENEFMRINKALEKTAKRADVEELAGTLSLLSPLRSKFVTEEDVKRILKEKNAD